MRRALGRIYEFDPRDDGGGAHLGHLEEANAFKKMRTG